MYRLNISFFLLVIFCLIIGDSYAQTSLNPIASGKKKIVLTNEAGQNIIEFLSSAPLEDIHGTANKISGEILLNADTIEQSTGKIVVDVYSMETGIEKRDRHLQSEEWLDAEKYPTIEFQLEKIADVEVLEKNAGKAVLKGTAVGKFTLHGVTKALQIPFTMTYLKESPQTRQRTSGDLVLIESNFAISLKDFNITGRKGLIGKRVGETIQITARFFGATR